MRLKWATLAACLICLMVLAGVAIYHARADGIGSPTAATLQNTWSVIVSPVSQGQDVVGYNVYIFQEKTGMLWAWEHYAEDKALLRIPTRDQYEGDFTITGASEALGRKH